MRHQSESVTVFYFFFFCCSFFLCLWRLCSRPLTHIYSGCKVTVRHILCTKPWCPYYDVSGQGDSYLCFRHFNSLYCHIMDSDNVIHQNTVWLMIDAAPLRLLTGEKKKKTFTFEWTPFSCRYLRIRCWNKYKKKLSQTCRLVCESQNKKIKCRQAALQVQTVITLTTVFQRQQKLLVLKSFPSNSDILIQTLPFLFTYTPPLSLNKRLNFLHIIHEAICNNAAAPRPSIKCFIRW